MNKYNRAVLNSFQAPANVPKLMALTMRIIGGKYPQNDVRVVETYLRANLHTHVRNFAVQAASDLSYSPREPSATFGGPNGGELSRQLDYINSMFVTQLVDYIGKNVLGKFCPRCGRAQTGANLCVCNNNTTANDGLSFGNQRLVRNAPRQQLRENNTSAIEDHPMSIYGRGIGNDPLVMKIPATNNVGGTGIPSEWQYIQRPSQFRDDTLGTLTIPHVEQNYRGVDDVPTETFISDEPGNPLVNEDLSYSSGHVDRLLENKAIQQLNYELDGPNGNNQGANLNGALRKPKIQISGKETANNMRLWVDGDGFVDQSSDSAMAHLFSRRTTRNWNGTNVGTRPQRFLRYQVAMHSRQYDRNNDNLALNGNERDNFERGYGTAAMRPIYERMPKKIINGQPVKFQPFVDIAPHMLPIFAFKDDA